MPSSPDSTFTAEERAAMKARARELKAEAKATRTRDDGERDVRAALDALPEPDRALGERFHKVVAEAAPSLVPRLWYGMPAYAQDGKVVCFFQAAQKFSSRYATVGFSDTARLDDGTLWPTAFAVTAWTDAVETRLRALVQAAVA